MYSITEMGVPKTEHGDWRFKSHSMVQVQRTGSRFISGKRDENRSVGGDLPPLKWSSLKYVLTMEDEINCKEAAYG